MCGLSNTSAEAKHPTWLQAGMEKASKRRSKKRAAEERFRSAMAEQQNGKTAQRNAIPCSKMWFCFK